jgi:photosystem II stability/assembly factor-like uncharacterized protein
VGSEGIILHSSDRGENWITINSGVSTSLHAVFFINKEVGWIVGGNETILKTADKGMNWEIQHSASTGHWLTSVFFHDTNIGWAVGEFDRIFKTTNGGLDWKKQSSINILNHYQSVYFVNDSIGWIAGYNDYGNFVGIILKTTNGGITWEQKDIAGEKTFHYVYFKNPSIGWLVGKNINLGIGYALIYHTTDGGESWGLRYSGSNNTGLYSLNFANDSLAITTGWYGTVIKSADAGNSWSQDYSHTTSSLQSVISLSQDEWIIVGGNGTILKSTNSFVTSNEEVIELETVDNYKLSQNYPNPFNPITKIKFTIPTLPAGRQGLRFTTLKIYDVLGREVATLVNEEKPAGVYEVEFSAIGGSASGGDALTLPSGIYFYRIKAGNFIETKKMVLLK